MRMIHIRRANRFDIEAIMAIEPIFGLDQWNKLQMESEIINPYSNYIVALVGDTLVGYCGFLLIQNQADVQTIAVDPKYQHQGIATQLMNANMQYCKENKIDEVFLEVDVTNVNAIGLYEKLAFDIISKRKHYYANGHDAYVMKKELV